MKKNLLVLLTLPLLSCSQAHPGEPSEIERLEYQPEQNQVEVMVLEETVFQKELVSNGKLSALRKSELNFTEAGTLVAVNVKNGDRVEAGQVIAKLDQTRLENAVGQAEVRLEQARLELEDILIGQGYNSADSGSVPPEVLELAGIRSGYRAALSDLATAQLNLAGSELIAPFAGIIANLNHKVHEQISQGDVFCTLIDNSVFEVNFSVLEDELTEISPGKEIKIMPFGQRNTQFAGAITAMNPLVDENGLIRIQARIRGHQGLMEGMNVRVLVETEVPGQLVVPKDAVLLRDNLEVMFRYTNGKAYWTYVHTGFENSTSYAVTPNTDRGAGLVPGDTVIVSGNLNLAHNSDVVINSNLD